MNAGKRLKNLSGLFAERKKDYKDGYKRHGDVIVALFPNGINQSNPVDAARFSLVTCLVIKLIRYCDNFDRGGHEDSLDDMAVYSQILQSYDKENESENSSNR